MAVTLNEKDKVGTWVTNHPATSRIFEHHRIDYCCGGNRSLEEACRAEQVDLQSVLAELQEVLAGREHETEIDFASLSLTEMCNSIESTHHDYLRRELPRLTELVDKVVRVHGDQHSWLSRLGESFHHLLNELMPHMMKEEQVLFPAIRVIEQSQSMPVFPFGSLDNPIHMMEHEHDEAGQALKEIRAASSDFALPDGGCNTFRAMLDALRELEYDLHRHIHKENSILFPKAMERAAELTKTH